jgi:hypothetical protein
MILQLLKAANKRKMERLKGFFVEKKERFDLNLPLNFALDRGVLIDNTPFILAGEDNLLVMTPNGEGKIVSIGQIDINLGGDFKIYRFYLQYQNDQDAMIQLVQDKANGDIIEILYLKVIDEVYPENSNDWDMWINDENGLLGYKDFNTPGGITYLRTLPEHGGEKVDPIYMKEHISIDPFNSNEMETDHEMVFYGRAINEDVSEYCIVSQENDDEGEYIRILIGIPLDPSFITVI